MQPHELLSSARVLLKSKQGRPTEASLRRAMSAGYYAMFHCVCHQCADLLIGPKKSKRSEAAWQLVYRSLDHKTARNRCRHDIMKKFPDGISGFAVMFATMQERRHDADYNPAAQFTRTSVTADLQAIEAAMKAFKNAPLADRRAFCAFLLFALREEPAKKGGTTKPRNNQNS